MPGLRYQAVDGRDGLWADLRRVCDGTTTVAEIARVAQEV